MARIVGRRIGLRARKVWIGMGFLRLGVGRGGPVAMCARSIDGIRFIAGIILFSMRVGSRFSPLRSRTNAGFTMIIAVTDLIYNLILFL